MRIVDKLSIKTVTVAIFMMVGIVAIVLSLFAGTYFRQAALDAQVSSLSRVIEVASQEILREVSKQTFDLGMKLGHNRQLLQALQEVRSGTARDKRLVTLLDDPFINGFVGFAKINLVKLRVYSPRPGACCRKQCRNYRAGKSSVGVSGGPGNPEKQDRAFEGGRCALAVCKGTVVLNAGPVGRFAFGWIS